jgi:phosphoserine phosphatase
MTPRWVRLATFDIDGTLTLVHGWQEIAEAFGRSEEYDTMIARFRAGGVSEDEHINRLLNLARGHTVGEVQAAVARTPKLRHIADGVRTLHERGVVAALLTHNPDYVTRWYRSVFGFDDAGGLVGTQDEGPPIAPAAGLRANKTECLVAMLDRQQVPAAAVVHVGDAAPDAEIFRQVGGGIALNAKHPSVEQRADRALRTDEFLEVVATVLELPPRG